MIALSPSTAAAIALHAAEGSWVMFVQAVPPSAAGMGAIKIEGLRGSQLGTRLLSLARDNAYDVQLIGLLPSIEPSSHAQQIAADFEAAHLHDGWFSPESYLLIFIEHQAQAAMQSLLAQTHPGALEGVDDSPVDIKRMAEILGISVSTLRRMVKAQEIPFLRWGTVYRFVPSDVVASLQHSDR